MRPRVKSYGDNSTVTLSPGRMRIKCMRILPETWARTLWPFSSSTRNMALGSGSTIFPSIWIFSSFAIPFFRIRLAQAGHDERRCLSHDDRVFEMRRQTSVLGHHGPGVVQNPHLPAACVDHGLDGESHPRLDLDP